MYDEAHERIRALELQNAALRARLIQHEPANLPLGLSPRELLLVEGERLAHVGSWTWDLTSGEIRWSDNLYRILGYDESVTPTSEAFFEAIHPDDRARVQRSGERTIQGDVTEPVEFRVVHKDGSVRHVHLEGAALLGANGQKTHLVGAILDLTDSKRSAALLLQTIEELRTAQRLALMGSYTVDTATMQATWSLGMYELLQIDVSETPTVDLFFAHVHPDDEARGREVLQQILATEVGTSTELRMRRKDGAVWHARVDTGVQRSASGLVLSGIVQDITRRKAEEERLRHSEKMAAVGTLAGGIAHDFNNCLTVLMGEADLLRLTLPRDQRGTRSLDAIVAAAERCSKLTSQLLMLGRKRSARRERVELGELVERLAPMVQAVLGERNEVVIRTAAPVFVRADPVELEHALMNLAVNARDALPSSGRCTLSVDRVVMDRAICGPGGHQLAQLSVSDTGVGIEREMLGRVFEPFFTTKGVGRGAGLGLATVYGVIQQAGGHVEVESELGHGTTFRLYLPLEETPHVVPSPVPLQAEPRLSAQGRTVLVVEDLPELRSVIRDQLLISGYRVELAEHGAAALELLATKGSTIDIVLSDVVMPVMGGFELEEAVRARYPHIRCALMTGYAERESERPHVGIALHKPFSRKELLAALNGLYRSESAIQPGIHVQRPSAAS